MRSGNSAPAFLQPLHGLLLRGNVVVIINGSLISGAWMSAACHYLTTLTNNGLSRQLSLLSMAINCPGISPGIF